MKAAALTNTQGRASPALGPQRRSHVLGQRARCAEQRRERIVSGADRVLGYAGLTTRAVADEAGVNHGLVHYYSVRSRLLGSIVAAGTRFQLGLILEGLSSVHETIKELVDWIQH